MNLIEYRREMIDRHTGILLSEELEVLSKAVICGAGAGGVGGWTYLSLARLGCLHFKIADPNRFNPSNTNRQAGSNFETIGQNKAEIIAKEIQRINPNAQVEIWSDGLRPETIPPFVEGASIVIDSIDLYELDTKKILFDIALKQKTPIISTPILGFGAALAFFHPTKSPSFEEFFGPIPNRSDQKKYNQYIKYFATGFFGFKPKLNWALYTDRVDTGKVPSIITSCMLAGALAATASVDYLLDRKSIPVVPTTIHIDLMQQKLVRTGPLRRWFLRKYVKYSFWHTNSTK
ncbi:ThiF family adenylyltransferase [bacterium]|nr:ThiF family adenylyltransferase [bacterium]